MQNICLTANRYDRLTRLRSTALEVLQDTLRESGLTETKARGGNPAGQFYNLLDTEPGLVYDAKGSKVKLSDLVSSMEITLQGGQVNGKALDLTVELGAEDIVQPLVGLDDKGVPQVNTTLEKLMVYHEPGIGDAPVLGRAFLEKVLVVSHSQFGQQLTIIAPALR